MTLEHPHLPSRAAPRASSSPRRRPSFLLCCWILWGRRTLSHSGCSLKWDISAENPQTMREVERGRRRTVSEHWTGTLWAKPGVVGFLPGHCWLWDETLVAGVTPLLSESASQLCPLPPSDSQSPVPGGPHHPLSVASSHGLSLGSAWPWSSLPRPFAL